MAQMLVLISMFSVVVFNITTTIICRSQSNQIEITLTDLNLTITGSNKPTTLNSVSTYDDPEILANCSGPTIPLNFKISITYTKLKLKESTGGKDKN